MSTVQIPFTPVAPPNGAQRNGERRPYPVGRLLDGQPRSILFDSAKCIGCRQCVEACKDWNDLPRGNYFNLNATTWLAQEPPVLEGLASVWGRNSCMHCEYPICAAVCPVEAITKYEEGPVVIDPVTCIGCEYCIYACPWHVISRNDVTGKATKCTGCNDRVAVGQSPFCVQSCPVEALDFGLSTDMQAKAEARAATLGAKVYGLIAAGGTHVVHVLTHSLAEHGLPLVSNKRYPRHHIPLRVELGGVLRLTGGPQGKLRAVTNALTKPWRLKYRYWHRPG
jgi:formate dehydrogenase iron-sulfur subunit